MSETGAILARVPVAAHAPRTFDPFAIEGHFRRRVIVACSLIAGDMATGELVAGPVLGPATLSVLAALTVLILASALNGLYSGFGPGPCERLRLRTQSACGFVVAEFLIAGIMGLPEAFGPVLSGLLFIVAGHYIEACVRGILIRRGLWGATTAVVGSDATALATCRQLLENPEIGLRPVGFVAASDGTDRADSDFPLPLLGLESELERVAHDVEVLIFTSPTRLRARECPVPARQLAVAGAEEGIQSLLLRTRALGRQIGIELRRDLDLRRWRLLKRGLDMSLALPATMLSAPVIAALAMLIMLIDPGPAFYPQTRVGARGRTIRIFKLRTMYRDAEQRLQEHLARDPEARAEWNRFFKLTNDPRVLPVVGRFLRQASLDELPQFWNILRGDMSLVGPRPFPSYHIASFDAAFQQVRASVPPGLTGLWQVSGRSNGDLEVQRSQDLFYVVNWSIWLDLYVLLQTPVAVLLGNGAK